MPNVRACVVSFSDTEGMTHSVEVAAASVYEAAALAVKAFRTANLIPDAVPSLTTRFTVSVKAPTMAHELTLGKLEAWARSNGKSPKEHALKGRLRELLAL